MADLDFRHNVQEIPAGAQLPPPVRRSVTADVTPQPDVQSAISNYAANTNWMSEIGSAVANRASTAIATKLGNQLGQNPQGDLSPPLTDFDKTMAASYQTQAHATLGLQANKIITDSNLEMAKAPRITPALIDKTNRTVSLGLQNIFKNAPMEIRPSMELQYGTQQLNQASELTDRMLREQKEDRKANTAYASEMNAQNAHSLAMTGNYEAAFAAVSATEAANKADVAAGISTPLLAKTNIDAARQSALTGKYSHEYEVARKNGKGAEYLRSLAEKKPSDIPDADYPVVMSHMMNYVNMQDTLRKQDQALALAKFNVSLSKNPLGITNSQVVELNSHLDPLQQQEASLAYVKAIKKNQSDNSKFSTAIANYTDINTFPQESPANKNAAWEATYKAIQNKPENIASGMTEDTAKLYAAAAAPVSIPAYINELNAKATTPIPANLEAVGQAVNYLQKNNLGQNLTGFGDKQEAMLEAYSQLRDVMPPQEAAQKAHEAVYNKSKEQLEANKQALTEYYKSQKNKNETPFAFVRRILQTPSNLKIRNLPGYTQKAQKVFENYFNLTNGDEATAQKLTKQLMDRQYGESNVNGTSELSYHPVENIPGVPHDAIGPIQSDIVEQANSKLIKQKEDFDNKKIDYWYEVKQRITPDEAKTAKRIVDSINQGYEKHPITGAVFDIHGKRKEYTEQLKVLRAYNGGQPMSIIKHNRSGKDEVFEGIIEANPWGVNTGNPASPVAGGYDFKIKTENGAKNITLFNPLNSNVNYNPRVGYIKDLYINTVGLSTLQYMAGNTKPGSLFHDIYSGAEPNPFLNKALANR